MRTTFIETLIEQARVDDSIFLLTPDLGFSVFEKFIDSFPNRFLNVGIAEQNAVSIAAGLSLSGYKPYLYSIVPFVTMRCFEQIRVDVAYMNTNVKLVGVGGVITSYSIHYTKLYEASCPREDDDRDGVHAMATPSAPTTTESLMKCIDTSGGRPMDRCLRCRHRLSGSNVYEAT